MPIVRGDGPAWRGGHEEDRLSHDKLRQSIIQSGVDLAHDSSPRDCPRQARAARWRAWPAAPEGGGGHGPAAPEEGTRDRGSRPGHDGRAPGHDGSRTGPRSSGCAAITRRYHRTCRSGWPSAPPTCSASANPAQEPDPAPVPLRTRLKPPRNSSPPRATRATRAAARDPRDPRWPPDRHWSHRAAAGDQRPRVSHRSGKCSASTRNPDRGRRGHDHLRGPGRRDPAARPHAAGGARSSRRSRSAAR